MFANIYCSSCNLSHKGMFIMTTQQGAVSQASDPWSTPVASQVGHMKNFNQKVTWFMLTNNFIIGPKKEWISFFHNAMTNTIIRTPLT